MDPLTLDPSRPPIPVESPGDPLIQIYLRLPAEHSPRLVDAERPVLEVEVEASPVERRLDTEGPAKVLAKGGRGIEGASRPMEPGRRDTGLLGDEPDELLDRGVARPGQNEGLAQGGGGRRRFHEQLGRESCRERGGISG